MSSAAVHLGPEVDPTPAAFPDKTIRLKGEYVTLEAFKSDHDYTSFWENLRPLENGHLFDYLPLTIPKDENELREQVQRFPIAYAIKADRAYVNPRPKGSGVPTGKAEHSEVVGLICYLNISTSHRELEVGGVVFGPVLQRSAAATEVNYLLLKNVFEPDSPGLGGKSPPYRRVCWKCNHLNKKSRRAAERLGYMFEGTFRKHLIVKGRSRDSDWLSIVDDEWPVVKTALEKWLDRSNFDDEGRQIKAIDEIRASLK